MAGTMPDLTELQQAALAYFVAVPANEIVIAGRFYPRKEIELIVEDKVAIATRKFGPKVKACAKPVGQAFAAAMIDAGGWSTKPNEYGGTMHQFQPDVFKTALKAMQAGDPLVRGSEGRGAEFWSETFARLTGA